MRDRTPRRGGLFPIPGSEKAALVFLVAFSVVAFLPLWTATELAGMVVFGWLMAALMLLSPALMLLVFAAGRRRQRRR